MPNLFERCRDGVSSAKPKIRISRAQCQIYLGIAETEYLRRSQNTKIEGGSKFICILPRRNLRSADTARSRADGLARADLRDARMQPSARGRLRAAAVPSGTANSSFKIQNSKLRQTAEHVWAYMPVRAAACGAPIANAIDKNATNQARDAACGGPTRSGPAGRE